MQFDQPVRFAPWGKALPGFDWYRGCTSDCEPSCEWSHPAGDTRYDWGQTFNCKHGVKTWDAPYASFDAYFTAKMTAWKSSFDGSGLTLENDPRFGIYIKYANAAAKKESEVVAQFTSIYQTLGEERLCAWTNAITPQARPDHTGPHTTPFARCTPFLEDSISRRISPPTPRFQSPPATPFNSDRRLSTPPRRRLARTLDPQACERETKNDVLTVLSLAFANAELAAMTWITLIPIFIMRCCGTKSTYRERVEAPPPEPRPNRGPTMFLVPTPSSKEELEARQRAEREAAEKHNAERKAAKEAAKLEKKASKMERAASKKKPEGEDPSTAV